MGYERKVWQTGDYIYTKDLNNIEDGIGELQAVKADRSDVQAAAAAADRHEARIADIDGAITGIREEIGGIETDVAQKADAGAVAGIAAGLDETQARLDELNDRVQTKADTAGVAMIAVELSMARNDVDAVKRDNEYLRQEVASAHAAADANDGQIGQLELRMNMKADRSDVAGLAQEVGQKADRIETEDQMAVRADRTALAGLYVGVEQASAQADRAGREVNSVRQAVADVLSAMDRRVPKPPVSPEGRRGQVLGTNGDGTTVWTDPAQPTDEQIGEAVSAWLEDHPEATTTVEDGSITEAKLADGAVSEDKLSGSVYSRLTGSGREDVASAELSRLLALESRSREIMDNVATMEAWQPVITRHSLRYMDDGYGFLYFTDPHNLTHHPFGSSPYDLMDDMRFIRTIYEHTPAKAVLCGGDWLNMDYTVNEMSWRVGRVQNLLHTEIGPDAWTVFGNHDDGAETSSSTSLTRAHVARMWFGRDLLYYKLDGGQDVDIYMLEADYSTSRVTDDQWAQLTWLGEQLTANTKPHLFGVGHIVLGSEGRYFGEALCQMLEAFNKKSSITLHGKTWQFGGTTGTWHFILTGHYHVDHLYSAYNMPVVLTVNFSAGRAMELAYANWNEGKLYLDRVGEGSSRVIDIIPTGGYAPAT